MKLETTVDAVVNNISPTEGIAIDRLIAIVGEHKELMITGTMIIGNGLITRSTALNAFSKLEIAGVIKTRGRGMKGTHVEVLNYEALVEIANKVKL